MKQFIRITFLLIFGSLIIYSCAKEELNNETALLTEISNDSLVPSEVQSLKIFDQSCSCTLSVTNISPANTGATLFVVPELTPTELCSIEFLPDFPLIPDFTGLVAGFSGTGEIASFPVTPSTCFDVYFGNINGVEVPVTATFSVSCAWTGELPIQTFNATLGISSTSPWDVTCFCANSDCEVRGVSAD